MNSPRLVGAILVSAMLGAPPVHAQNEDLARRQLEDARANLRAARYTDGVSGLQRVIDQNGGTAVAADALLELATYNFNTSRDLPAAGKAAETLTTTYRQFANAA